MCCILTTTCCGGRHTSGEVSMGSSGMLEAIRWQMGPPASLRLLDQRLLPAQSVYIEIDGPQAAFTAIKVVLTCLDAFESAIVRLNCIALHQITPIVLRRSLTQRSTVSYNLLGSSEFEVTCPAEKRRYLSDIVRDGSSSAGYGSARSSRHCDLRSSCPGSRAGEQRRRQSIFLCQGGTRCH